MKPNYDLLALMYAEDKGIIEYKVKGCKMIWYEVYPYEGSYKAVRNLRSNQTVRTQLKRRPNKGLY